MSADQESELPQRIGPYRIERLAGKGGMGEVYRAFDERLERRVALKRIRAERETSQQVRQRFLREARAVARLSHPHIAQIYDIVENEDELWIVMEWVRGKSLRDLLDDGPMSLDSALRLAEEIAQGLTAAHAEGIVHRDLKSENVMIDNSGSAKILDFGLAKLEPLEGSAADSLTVEGMVIGTPRAMSPEQALGQAVDHRADFFSFGVLLYEAFTGISPFRSDSAEVTLRRLCIVDPQPIRVRAPAVPVHVESLISDLLAKEPCHRPASGAEILERLGNPHWIPDPKDASGTDSARFPTIGPTAVDEQAKASQAIEPTDPMLRRRLPDSMDEAGAPRPATSRHRWIAASAILVLLVALFAWRQDQRPPAERLAVAVLRPQLAIGTADDQIDLLAFTLHSAVLRTLTSFETGWPKSPEEVDAVSGPPSAIARATGADEVLTTTLVCKDLDCQAELGRIGGEDGELLRSVQVQVPIEDLLTAAKAISAGLFRLYPEEPERPDQTGLRVEPEDFAAYVDIRRTFETQPDILVLPTLLDQLEGLRGSSPRFVDVYLLEAKIATWGFQETREPRLLERGLDLIERAQSLARANPEVVSRRLWIEIQTGRFEQAEQTLAILERLIPGDVRVVDKRAQLLEKKGHAEEALALYRLAIDRRPSWQRYYHHADLAQQLGDLTAAKASLENLLELSPGNARGLSRLAYLEMKGGDPRRAAELYASLIAEAPTPARLTNLGLAHMLSGDYSASAEAFVRAVDQAPRHSAFVLNLADSRALEGRAEEAATLYRRVLTLIDEDPVDGYRQNARRAQALVHLGRHHEAIEALQEALRQAADKDAVAFEAALIYSLTGNYSAAIVNVKTALDLGFNHRWFRLPWFDELRNHPDFIELLEAESRS